MFKYLEIAEDIEASILKGTFKSQERLPSVVELCERYEVSRSTIQQAIDELSNRGLIARRRGSGLYVKSYANEADYYWSTYSDGIALMTAPTPEEPLEQINTIIEDFSVVRAESAVARALDIDEHGFVYYIYRVQKRKTEALALEYLYLSLDLLQGFSVQHASGSIEEYVTGLLGLRLSSPHRTIRSVMPAGEERAVLQIPFGVPLLEIEELGFLDNGRPYKYAVSHYPGTRYEFRCLK